jgi:uncharacterized protein (DUF302 family)
MSPGNGIMTRPSAYSFADTVAVVERVLTDRRVTIFARIDHSGEAARVGLRLPPTRLLIVGNPVAGTPIMIAAPTAALDLPIRILVTADAAGKTSVSYDTVEYLEARHGFDHVLGQALAVVDHIVADAIGASAPTAS